MLTFGGRVQVNPLKENCPDPKYNLVRTLADINKANPGQVKTLSSFTFGLFLYFRLILLWKSSNPKYKLIWSPTLPQLIFRYELGWPIDEETEKKRHLDQLLSKPCLEFIRVHTALLHPNYMLKLNKWNSAESFQLIWPFGQSTHSLFTGLYICVSVRVILFSSLEI